MLLLADVFEKFTSETLKFQKLYRFYYFSSPGLIMEAMLEMTGIKLEIISVIGKRSFIEKGLRGGISCICERFSEANQKYMKYYERKYFYYIS